MTIPHKTMLLSRYTPVAAGSRRDKRRRTIAAACSTATSLIRSHDTSRQYQMPTRMTYNRDLTRESPCSPLSISGNKARRVARTEWLGLAKLAGIKALIGYKRRPGSYGGKPSMIVNNTPARQFDVGAPDKIWVTDITDIRTQEGFAYLAVVIDLYSRRIVGWSMQSRQTVDVVLQALLMAVWRRKPKNKVLIHSDQGSQFTSMDWAAFLRAHNLEHSMSRRGNCHDNAVAEKPAKKRGRIYSITSKCSTTRSASTCATECCHLSSSSGREN